MGRSWKGAESSRKKMRLGPAGQGSPRLKARLEGSSQEATAGRPHSHGKLSLRVCPLQSGGDSRPPPLPWEAQPPSLPLAVCSQRCPYSGPGTQGPRNRGPEF